MKEARSYTQEPQALSKYPVDCARTQSERISKLSCKEHLELAVSRSECNRTQNPALFSSQGLVVVSARKKAPESASIPAPPRNEKGRALLRCLYYTPLAFFD